EADRLIAALAALGIDTARIVRAPDAVTASYTALIDPDGELVVGIADMAIYDGMDEAFFAPLKPRLAGHGVWFVDANPPAARAGRPARRRPAAAAARQRPRRRQPHRRQRACRAARSVAGAGRRGTRAGGCVMQRNLQIAPEVAAALAAGGPVVALESTIISHGMPYPRNLDTARRVEAIIRHQGAVPATIAVLDGRLRVGRGDAELERLATEAGLAKLSRRDLPIDHRAGSADEVARIMAAQWRLSGGGLVVANPITPAEELDPMVIDEAIATALEEAERDGIRGKAVTPYLLERLEALTGGTSLDANIALVLDNAAVGAAIAVAYAGQRGKAGE